MHRYSVKYIERSGGFAEAIVYARTRREARRKAAGQGLEDIRSVRRVGLPLAPIVVITVVIALIVALAVG